jgi:hypothetical protein
VELGRDFIFHPFVISRYVMGLVRNKEDVRGRDCCKDVSNFVQCVNRTYKKKVRKINELPISLFNCMIINVLAFSVD